MAEVYDLDTNAAGNNSAPPDGFPENMQYSQVNDAAREQMAVLARYVEALGAVTTTGTGNAYVLTIAQDIAGGVLTNGMHFIFKADKANTGAATLQVNGSAAVPLRDVIGTALPAGEITPNGVYFVVYDGTVFRIVGSESATTIKIKYESNADTNAFTDALLTKVNASLTEPSATALYARIDGTNQPFGSAVTAGGSLTALGGSLITSRAGEGTNPAVILVGDGANSGDFSYSTGGNTEALFRISSDGSFGFQDRNPTFQHTLLSATTALFRSNLNVSESGSDRASISSGPWVGVSDRYVNLQSVTAVDNLEYSLSVNEGANDRRARFFLSDEVGTFGLQGAATSGTPTFQLFLDAANVLEHDGTFMTTPSRMRVENSGDLSLTSVTHGFQIGLTNGINLGMDNSEIQVRNNGAAAALSLQAEGGAVEIGTSVAADLRVRRGGEVRVYEADNTSYLQVLHSSSSTDFGLTGTPGPHTFNLGSGYSQVSIVNGADLSVRDGSSLRLFDASGADSLAMTHDGTDFTSTFINTADWEVSGLLGEVDFNTTPVRVRRGINGSYAFDAGASNNWAAPIWSIGSDFDGSGDSGSGWTSTDHFGIHWARSSHSTAITQVGEGVYVRQNGTLFAGFGTAGGYVNGELNVWRDSGPHITLRDTNNTGDAMTNWLRFEDSAGTRHGFVGFSASGNDNLDLFNDAGIVRLVSAGVAEAQTQNSDAGGISSGLQVRDHAQVFRDVGWNVIPAYEIDVNDSFDVDHMSQMWHKDAGGAVSFTCVNTADIPNGATFMVTNDDSENVTLAQGAGVLIRWFDGAGAAPPVGDRTLAQAGYAVVYKYANNEYWVLGGVGVS